MNTDTPETDQWETYCDECYYHMWRLRRKTERGWHDGFHIHTGEEAKGLCDLLNKLERELAEARAEMIRWMSIAEGRGRTDDEEENDTQAELTQAYAKLDRILKLTIHDDTFWAIEEIARISGGESDCSVCGGCFMIPGSEGNDDVMNTPCPKCNDPETLSNQ